MCGEALPSCKFALFSEILNSLPFTIKSAVSDQVRVNGNDFAFFGNFIFKSAALFLVQTGTVSLYLYHVQNFVYYPKKLSLAAPSCADHDNFHFKAMRFY